MKANSGGKLSREKKKFPCSTDASNLSFRTWKRAARIWTVAWRHNLQLSFLYPEAGTAGAVKSG